MKFDLALHNSIYAEGNTLHTKQNCLCKRFKDGEEIWAPENVQGSIRPQTAELRRPREVVDFSEPTPRKDWKLRPLFGDSEICDDNPADEVAKENAEAVESKNFNEDHQDP